MDEGMGVILLLVCIFFVLFPGLLWVALKVLACVGGVVLVFAVGLLVKEALKGRAA